MLHEKLIVTFAVVLCALLIVNEYAAAKRQHPERWYQDKYCEQLNGVAEYILDDGTRVDCLTETHAIEFDFANKWAEAVGQSLHYGLKTGKQPGIVLIVESEKDTDYIKRVVSVIVHYLLPIEPGACTDEWLLFNEPDEQSTQGNE